MILVLIYLFLSFVLILIYSLNLENVFGWIDFPIHVLFGFLVAKLMRNDITKSTMIFLGWEVIEVILSFSDIDLVHRLFYESITNKILDLIADFIGFVICEKKSNQINSFIFRW